LFERKGVRVERKEKGNEGDDGEGWRELEEKMQMGKGKGKGKLNDGLLNGQALVGGTFFPHHSSLYHSLTKTDSNVRGPKSYRNFPP